MSCPAVTVDAGEARALMPPEVDLANADIIGAQIVSAIPREAASLTVDLSSTRYIDSAGIRMLLWLSERLRWRRQTLRVAVRRDSHLSRLLQLTGLDSRLTVRDAQTGLELRRWRFRSDASG